MLFRRLLALALLFLISCTAAPSAGPEASVPPPNVAPKIEIVILHTNDLHGQVYPVPGTWIDPVAPPKVGGILSLATALRRERDAARAAGAFPLTLDAGDVFQGTPEGNLTDGALMIDYFNALGYDAVCVGNHEFDRGPEVLLRMVGRARFPFLAANVTYDADMPLPRAEPFSHAKFFELGGVRVAVIGLLTASLKQITTKGITDGFHVEGEVEVAEREVRAARSAGAQVVVLLTHLGVEPDKRLASLVPGIDVIIGGHTHTALAQPYYDPVNGTMICQTGSIGAHLGVARIGFDPTAGRVASREARLIEIRRERYPSDPEVERILAGYSPRIAAVMDEKIGEIGISLVRTKGAGSSLLGNWITDVIREATGSDFAFHNKTGIRADLPPGEITIRSIYQVLPFENTLVTVELTGAQVKDLIEYSVRESYFGLEVSGLRFAIDPAGASGSRVSGIEPSRGRFDPQRTYKVVTNSFLAAGGDGFSLFRAGKRYLDSGIHLRDVVISYLRKRKGRLFLKFKDRVIVGGFREPALAPGGQARNERLW